jgi:pyruvate,water dikinase
LTRYEFDAERDMKEYALWIQDAVHAPRPMRPLQLCHWEDGMSYGFQHGAGKTSMPETHGWDLRVIDGYNYITVIECKPEEVPEREKAFREKVKPILDDFDGEWNKAMEKWMAVLDEFKQFDVEKATDIELRDHFEDYWVRLHHGMWCLHFVWYYPVFRLYTLFIMLCQELIGIGTEHPTFKSVITGFDNALFRVNREMWQLGDKAKELGLAQLFLATEDDEELLSEVEKTDAGRKWLSEHREFVKAEGWRNMNIWDTSTPTWLEKPSLSLRDIKYAIAKGGAFVLDAERERLARERQEVEREILAKVPAEQRDWFEKLTRIAQRANWLTEEHNYWLDMAETAIGRRLFIEFGKRFSRTGAIDDPEDVFFLVPDEIRKGSVPMGRVNLRPYVNMRGEEWNSYFKIVPKPFIGDITKFPDLARKDPIILFAAEPPKVKPELKADLYGCTSAPGVAEGIARVIVSDRDLGQVQPGEILIAPSTNAAWVPVFGIISGLVTDAGSSLCHAAIVSREYGIPAVVGTQEATRMIKTGDRIKLDGNMNAVYILKQ